MTDFQNLTEAYNSIYEGSLHKWFNASKSKDGKPGWVQSDGSPCANEKGETKTPKCYSSRRLAGLKKTKEGQKKIRSADARKSRQDSGQQSKSGAAKPTNVRTFTDKDDYKKHPSGDYTKKEETQMNYSQLMADAYNSMYSNQEGENIDEACWKGYTKKGMKTMFGKKYPNCVKKEEVETIEEADKKGKGSGTKDACYHKVKSRFKVWPSAYGSGALVKCRKAGAANWGNSSKKEAIELTRDEVLSYLVENGYAPDMMSAEVMFTHMSDEWMSIISEVTAFDMVKKDFTDKYGKKALLKPEQMKRQPGQKPKPVKYTHGDMSKLPPRAGESD